MIWDGELFFPVLGGRCLHRKYAVAAHAAINGASRLVWTEDKLTTAGAMNFFRRFHRHQCPTFRGASPDDEASWLLLLFSACLGEI